MCLTMTRPVASSRAPGVMSTPPERKENSEATFPTMSGKEQTDALFDTEIIARMGEDLYDQVFDPAI